MIKTCPEYIATIAANAKACRLALALTQAGLAARSGVSLGTIKLFERSGKISLESLLKLAIALAADEPFDRLFIPITPATTLSLDELLKQPKKRQRGSRQ